MEISNNIAPRLTVLRHIGSGVCPAPSWRLLLTALRKIHLLGATFLQQAHDNYPTSCFVQGFNGILYWDGSRYSTDPRDEVANTQ